MDQSTKGLKFLNVINGTIQAKTYTFVAFTVVILTILILGAIRPTLSKISQINNDIKIKREIDAQLTDKTNSLAALSNQYVDSGNKMRYLPLVFPSQGNFSLLLSNIDEITKSNGYNLMSINFTSADGSGVSTGTSVLKPWIARISVKGNKVNFIKLLQDLESLPMFPTVQKVSYSNVTSNDGLTAYSIELLIYKVNDANFYK